MKNTSLSRHQLKGKYPTQHDSSFRSLIWTNRKEADTQVVAIEPEAVSRAEEPVEPVKIETSPVYE